jgi:hypothetical protein
MKCEIEKTAVAYRLDSVEDEYKCIVDTTTVPKRAKPQPCAWLATAC